MTDEQPACPYCNTLSLNTRNPDGPGKQPDSEYYCRRCGRGVDNPTWRTRKRPRTRTPEGTVARALEDHDPDDLVADGGRAGYVAECDQCGIIEDGDLEDVGDAVENHDQFHDVEITRAATDGSGDAATWRLECMDCDYTDDVDVQSAEETPPRKVEREVTRHKNQHDESHVVRVHRRPEQRDIDPSLLTDGGVNGADEWCDWCQKEFQHGPTWKVDAAAVTGYFCSRACAEQWGNAETTPKRIDQPDVATDGGSKYTVETGDGYLGTWAVRNYSTEVNAVTAGLKRGEVVALVALDDTRVLLTRSAEADADRLAERTVNTDGYLSIGRTVLDHLDVPTGGDVRLYDADDRDGWILVDADDDPRVATDGGQRTPAAGGGATHPGVDAAVAQSVLEVLDEDNRLYYSAGNSTTGNDRSFHSSEDCRRLDRAKSTTSCNARRRPRGHLCSECFPEDVTVDDIDDALEEVDRDA